MGGWWCQCCQVFPAKMWAKMVHICVNSVPKNQFCVLMCTVYTECVQNTHLCTKLIFWYSFLYLNFELFLYKDLETVLLKRILCKNLKTRLYYLCQLFG